MKASLDSIPDSLTILIVEDRHANYFILEHLLKVKFKLHRAEDGMEAIDMLGYVKPDIILMDINMPNMDGYQTVEQMRKQGVKVPIIALPDYVFAADREHMLSSGFDAFVSKPVTKNELYTTLAEVWESKKIKK